MRHLDFALSCLLISSIRFGVVFCQDARYLLEKLMENYDSRVPPNFNTDKVTKVAIDMHISSVDSISEQTMDFIISVFLRQRWEDTRLSHRHFSNLSVISLDTKMVDRIWVPDLFFRNEKKAEFHDVTVPNRFLRIYENGSIYYSSRISLRLSCPMRLEKFPLDEQQCTLQMESYAHTTDTLLFEWNNPDPIEINEELELPQFELTDYKLSTCTRRYITGNFSCLNITLYLRRNIGFYMIQTYIPTALIVGLSWVSFWISQDAVPARISLGVLTILTMTTQASSSRQSLPRVSYIKAIDIWMATCLVFVFAALLEFAIVNVLSRNEIRRKSSLRDKMRNDQVCQKEEELKSSGKMISFFVRDPKGKEKAKKVDKGARAGFPLAYFTFNLVYWITYVFWQP
ncbi:DgyrCDS3969 [Dimorphilus gyrociliatus]|uniref:DgyrCDS3969 n=1 Tax=Dimorphilus gyrociliatus TaxID=2664684 RepID=A0A7I8VFI4_9ANNE|nr:DgyrCDS3969 [Dimorphilus gyrociliatus]